MVVPQKLLAQHHPICIFKNIIWVHMMKLNKKNRKGGKVQKLRHHERENYKRLNHGYKQSMGDFVPKKFGL